MNSYARLLWFQTLEQAPEPWPVPDEDAPQDGQVYQAKTPELPETWESGPTHTQTQCEHGWRSASWL